MNRMRGLTLAVRFGCELAVLAALAWWGFSVGDGVGAWLLGLGQAGPRFRPVRSSWSQLWPVE